MVVEGSGEHPEVPRQFGIERVASAVTTSINGPSLVGRAATTATSRMSATSSSSRTPTPPAAGTLALGRNPASTGS